MDNHYTVENFVADRCERADKYISSKLKLTRSFVQKLFTDGNVFVNSKPQKQGFVLGCGDSVTVKIPEAKALDVSAEDIRINIVYEDDDVIVINKDRGMVVHPAAGNPNGTLVNALLSHCRGRLSQINGVIRPGIVHRIDKDTTGLLVVAKNNHAHLSLAEQIKSRELKRRYYALVHGSIQSDGVVDVPIARHRVDRKKMAVNSGGRESVTMYEPVRNYNGYTLLRCSLKTGRTHQIRVHMNHISHSIVGDKVYGRKREEFSNLQGQLLHAYQIGFSHPKSGKYVEFFAPLPQDFRKIIKILNGRKF